MSRSEALTLTAGELPFDNMQVKSDERTAVMGITSTIRTLAAMAGPTLTGLLADNDKFGVAFIAAGVCRLAYDFGLYALFVNMKLDQYEKTPSNVSDGYAHVQRDEEEVTQTEMESLVGSDTDIESDDTNEEWRNRTAGDTNHLTAASGPIRNRSPRRTSASVD